MLQRLHKRLGIVYPTPRINYEWFQAKCKQVDCAFSRAVRSLGSCGSGNHFIEFGVSEQTGDTWFTIHTGSRNFGKCVCEYWQGVARSQVLLKRFGDYDEKIREIRDTAKRPQDIPRLIKEFRKSLGIEDVKTDLEYLQDQDMAGYLVDMVFAQAYAHINRSVISFIISEILKVAEPKEAIESVHNFICFNDFIIRKGAIRSYVGEKMIIPFNQVDGLILCEGKSNPDWNYSAPHGAGRVLSRNQAKKDLDQSKYERQMKAAGIYSTSVNSGTLDEAPDAYKKASVIEEAIEPTATIIDRLKPIIAMKDDGGNSLFLERKKAKRAQKKERREFGRAKMEEREQLLGGTDEN